MLNTLQEIILTSGYLPKTLLFYSGLEHEQSRPDRGYYITIHYGNIDGSKSNLVKLSIPYTKKQYLFQKHFHLYYRLVRNYRLMRSLPPFDYLYYF